MGCCKKIISVLIKGAHFFKPIKNGMSVFNHVLSICLFTFCLNIYSCAPKFNMKKWCCTRFLYLFCFSHVDVNHLNVVLVRIFGWGGGGDLLPHWFFKRFFLPIYIHTYNNCP